MMKNLFLFMFCIVFFISVKGQINDYDDAIREGDEALKNNKFKEAINKYFAAEAFEPKMKVEVKEKVKIAFDSIMALRNKADTLRQEAEDAKIATQRSLAQTQKIISAFYFYEEQFALAYKNNKYGFINQEGEPLINYKYEAAQPFDNNGLSRVKLDNQAYLLDNKKNEYRLASGPDKLPSASEAPDLAIDLSNLQLISFPGKLVHASNLKVLLINGNEIRQLPDSIRRMSQLRKFFIYNNKLEGLPDGIGSLSSLITLDASINKLLQLPETIGDLDSLEELVLYDNNLTGLPESIGGLQKLFFLDLSDNLLSSLPEKFKELDSLRILAIGENQFKEFPAGLDSLPGLIMLDLGGNFISVIPPWIKDFDRMTHLHVWKNQLDSLPDEITGLENLKVLYAGDNRLASLPRGMDSLGKLQELILYGNRLKEIPAELGRMDSLRKIDLRNNPDLNPGQVFTVFSKTNKQLLINTSNTEPDFLPTERTLLIRIDTFDSLPKQLAEMDKLVLIDLLSSRKITAVDIDETFKAYPKKIVYSSAVLPKVADSTQLLINVDIIPLLGLDTAQARKLEKLDLSNRNLEVIPDVVFTLEKLESLNLNGNKLAGVPAEEIGRLKQLKALYLLNNPVPEEEKEKIRAALPVGCMVHFDNVP